MADTRDYMDYLDDEIGIAPANSQEEFQAAEKIVEVMKDHGLEPTVQEFDAHPFGKLMPYLMMILLVVGILMSGIGTEVVRLLGFALVVVSAGLLIAKHMGKDYFKNMGGASRSQNVIAVHRATGDKVVKGARPIVIVAHYDTPHENMLFGSGLGRYQSLIKKMSVPCVITIAIVGVAQILLFLPSVVRTLLWIVGLIAAVPLIILIAAAISERFSPCTEGSNDNKSSVAALLSIMSKVHPAEDRVDAAVAGKPYVPRQSEPPAQPIKIVEEVKGVRHGRDVLMALGVLPATCEIVYEEPKVRIVQPAASDEPEETYYQDEPVTEEAAPLDEPAESEYADADAVAADQPEQSEDESYYEDDYSQEEYQEDEYQDNEYPDAEENAEEADHAPTDDFDEEMLEYAEEYVDDGEGDAAYEEGPETEEPAYDDGVDSYEDDVAEQEDAEEAPAVEAEQPEKKQSAFARFRARVKDYFTTKREGISIRRGRSRDDVDFSEYEGVGETFEDDWTAEDDAAFGLTKNATVEEPADNGIDEVDDYDAYVDEDFDDDDYDYDDQNFSDEEYDEEELAEEQLTEEELPAEDEGVENYADPDDYADAGAEPVEADFQDDELPEETEPEEDAVEEDDYQEPLAEPEPLEQEASEPEAAEPVVVEHAEPEPSEEAVPAEDSAEDEPAAEEPTEDDPIADLGSTFDLDTVRVTSTRPQDVQAEPAAAPQHDTPRGYQPDTVRVVKGYAGGLEWDESDGAEPEVAAPAAAPERAAGYQPDSVRVSGVRPQELDKEPVSSLSWDSAEDPQPGEAPASIHVVRRERDYSAPQEPEPLDEPTLEDEQEPYEEPYEGEEALDWGDEDAQEEYYEESDEETEYYESEDADLASEGEAYDDYEDEDSGATAELSTDKTINAAYEYADEAPTSLGSRIKGAFARLKARFSSSDDAEEEDETASDELVNEQPSEAYDEPDEEATAEDELYFEDDTQDYEDESELEEAEATEPDAEDTDADAAAEAWDPNALDEPEPLEFDDDPSAPAPIVQTATKHAMRVHSADDTEENDILPKDTTGLDTFSDSYDVIDVQEPAQKPDPIDDPTWGQSSFVPPRPVNNIARRAALFDLPDPSGAAPDPLASQSFAAKAAAPAVQPADDEYDENEELGATNDFSDIDEADEVSDSNRRRKWKGGAAIRSDLRGDDYGDEPLDDPDDYAYDDQAYGDQYADDAYEDQPYDDGETYYDESEAYDDADAAELPAASDDEGAEDYDDAEPAEPTDEEPAPADEADEEAPDQDDLEDAILQLGDDYLIAHDIWFVAVGASDVNHAGIKALLSNFKRDMRGAFVINLDAVGAGHLTMLTSEGLHDGRRADRRVSRLLASTAQDLHIELDKAPYDWEETDATEAMRSHLRSVTIMGMDENGLPALSRTQNDVPMNVDPKQVSKVVQLVTELIRRA